MKVIAATNNKGKIKEITDILSKLGYEVISLKEAGIVSDPEENGKTLHENALIKARAVSALTDMCVIADDSGLFCDALSGAPGIYSARYAGEGASDDEKINRLLSELSDKGDRSAHFECSIVFIDENKNEIYADGRAEGEILLKKEGSGGFGYDPVFFSHEAKKPFGIMSEEEKNKVSHRFHALENLCKLL